MSEFAIFQTGGKQYRVKEGDIIKVEKLDATGSVDFDQVLMVGDKVGNPFVKGAKVVADVIDIIKHKGKHIDVNMKAEKAVVSPKDNAVRSFFVRVPAESTDQAKEIFGSKIEVIDGGDKNGEFAFVTDMISEKDFEERLWKLDSVKGYIRLF